MRPPFPRRLESYRSRVAGAPSRAGAVMAKEIFYLAPGSMLTAVSVTEGTGTLLFGTLQPLFQMHGRAPISSSDLFTYDVARDGRRFLVNRYLNRPTCSR